MFKPISYFCVSRGCTESRDKQLTVPGASDLENYIYTKECHLGLHKVNYEQFQGAIKRFGYRVDLNEQHLRAISKEIRLDQAEMFNHEASIYRVFYS